MSIIPQPEISAAVAAGIAFTKYCILNLLSWLVLNYAVYSALAWVLYSWKTKEALRKKSKRATRRQTTNMTT